MPSPRTVRVVLGALVPVVLLSACAAPGGDPAPEEPTDAQVSKQIMGEVGDVVRRVLLDVARDVDGTYPNGVSGHYVGCGNRPSASFYVAGTLQSPGRPAAIHARIKKALVAEGLRVSDHDTSISGRRDGLVLTFFSLTRRRRVTTGYLELASRCAELSPASVERLEELPDHAFAGLPETSE